VIEETGEGCHMIDMIGHTGQVVDQEIGQEIEIDPEVEIDPDHVAEIDPDPEVEIEIGPDQGEEIALDHVVGIDQGQEVEGQGHLDTQGQTETTLADLDQSQGQKVVHHHPHLAPVLNLPFVHDQNLSLGKS